ncbi:MAG: aminotransferase DegT [Legionellaceae bacterium]|nr:aminotransferase DegT [Legionellaceae bacterium]
MIVVNEPLIRDEEINSVLTSLKDGWISSEGPAVKLFEERWADYCSQSQGVAVSSGTAALQLALQSLDLEPGDEIIMPSFTIISCALAAVNAGLKPVFVDCHPDTWTMNEGQLEKVLTTRTRAVMPVHIYGHPCDMDPIIEFAKKHDLIIIEDAAEAHGAEYKGKKCGSFGDIACFSFYANKIITTGEGGMLLTSNPEYAERARRLRNLGFEAKQRFYHHTLGYNFRLTSMQAALALPQVDNIDALIAKKIKMAGLYHEGLRDIEGLELPIEKSWAKNVYWMYAIVLDESHGTALDVMKLLREEGVATRPFFMGMHEQPVLREKGLVESGVDFSVTERIARQGFYLPSGLAITESQIHKVIEVLRKVLINR